MSTLSQATGPGKAGRDDPGLADAARLLRLARTRLAAMIDAGPDAAALLVVDARRGAAIWCLEGVRDRSASMSARPPAIAVRAGLDDHDDHVAEYRIVMRFLADEAAAAAARADWDRDGWDRDAAHLAELDALYAIPRARGCICTYRQLDVIGCECGAKELNAAA